MQPQCEQTLNIRRFCVVSDTLFKMVRPRKVGPDAAQSAPAAEGDERQEVSRVEGLLDTELSVYDELAGQISTLKAQTSEWEERYALSEAKAKEDRRKSDEIIKVLETKLEEERKKNEETLKLLMEKNRILEIQCKHDHRLRDEALRQMEEQSAQREAAVERDRAALLEARTALAIQAEQDRAVVAEANRSLREALRSITPSLTPVSTPRQTPVPSERTKFTNLQSGPSSPHRIEPAGQSTRVAVYMEKEPIPKFSGDTPAFQPLRRNQEIERWIRQIENLSNPPNDNTFIRNARASCRGPADLIINSPIFDSITIWGDFKSKLRQKFRGTCSASDYFRLLHERRLVSGQAPLDFYIALEGAVYQGVRDYPEAIGEPDELIRRLFLQGLPGWLREMCAMSEDAPLKQLVDVTQRVWNARMGVRAEEEGPARLFPSSARSGSKVAGIEEGGPDGYSRPLGLSPRRPSRRIDQFTRPASRTCWACRREGHFRRECPFLNIPSRTGPAASGEEQYLRRQGSRVQFHEQQPGDSTQMA